MRFRLMRLIYSPLTKGDPHFSSLHFGGQDSLFAAVGDVVGDAVATVQNHDQSLTVVGLLEWRDSTHQHVQDDAQRPDICNTHEQKCG